MRESSGSYKEMEHDMTPPAVPSWKLMSALLRPWKSAIRDARIQQSIASANTESLQQTVQGLCFGHYAATFLYGRKLRLSPAQTRRLSKRS